MAYLNATYVGYTDVTLGIDGLQYPPGDYSEFHFRNQTTGRSYYTTITTKYISDLQENTTYTFFAEAKYQGVWYPVGTVTITTLYHEPPPIPPYPPIITARIEGGLSLEWGYVADVTYRLRYRKALGSYTEYTMLDNYYTLKNLEYGVTYYFSVRSNDTWNPSEYTSENAGTTAPKTPGISQGTTTNNSIQINIYGMQGNYDYVRVRCYNSNWQEIGSQYGNSGSSVTFTGLTQGQTYYFQGQSYLTVNGTTLESVYYTQIEVVLSTRPENFEWTWGKTSGDPFYVSAEEWNRFANKVNEFRRYKGLNDYSFTTVGSNGDFTAGVFNQAINAMNDLSSYFTGGNTIPSTQSKDNLIYAYYFNWLRNALNSIQ